MAYAAILGASGYSGQETLDRVLAHPELELVALGSDSLAGEPASALDPRLARNGAAYAPAFVPNDEALASGADVVFLCLGHEHAAALEPPATRRRRRPLRRSPARRPARVRRVVRLRRIPRPDDLERLERTRFPSSCRRPAGSSPTPAATRPPFCSRSLPLAGAIDPTSVVVDAKSGVSGAGRALKASSHAGAVLENVTPYRVGAHQHAPEIAQALGFPVCFVPHLLPVRRGLIATCYAHAGRGRPAGAARGGLRGAPTAVTVLPEGIAPELSRVQGTDAAEIGALHRPRRPGRAIVICALDNLGKGAAGQAIQNANLALGLAETEGLRLPGVLV